MICGKELMEKNGRFPEGLLADSKLFPGFQGFKGCRTPGEVKPIQPVENDDLHNNWNTAIARGPANPGCPFLTVLQL